MTIEMTTDSFTVAPGFRAIHSAHVASNGTLTNSKTLTHMPGEIMYRELDPNDMFDIHFVIPKGCQI